MKHFLALILLTGNLFFFQAQEKNLVDHTVEKGETLYSIAKKYKVTPYQIILENKDISSPEDLKAGNTVIIPLHYAAEASPKPVITLNGASEKKEDTKNQDVEKTSVQTEETFREPIGYTNHLAKKKETLYGISKQYGVTEEEIKRYNRVLYASQLKKGMNLLIPKFAQNPSPELTMVKDSTEKEGLPLDYIEYTVGPKETRWSIAHQFGITIDELLELNPDLDPNTAYLALGQNLKVPRPKGDSLNEQEVIIFESFTVPQSMGLFRLSQNYGIPVDSIMNLNPQIQQNNGLKEGMVLRLPKKKKQFGKINTDGYNFYSVRAEETIFNLTKTLNISRDSLYLLNPQLDEGLKAGMVIKIPSGKKVDFQVKNSLVLKRFDLKDSISVSNVPSIAFMLPFRLNSVDLSNSTLAEAQVERRKDIKYATGFYTGALIAIDSINAMGIDLKIKVIDTERDLNKVNLELQNLPWGNIDAIIGPVDPKLINTIATAADNHDVPLVLPFSSGHIASQKNMFYSMPSEAYLRKKMLDSVSSYYEKQNIIIIADKTGIVARDSIKAKFPTARPAKMSEDGSLHLIDFEAMLSDKEENWVFVESNNENLIPSIASILNAANGIENEEGDKRIVKMFTTSYNDAFENDDIEPTHLSNLNFTFCAAEKYPEDGTWIKQYEKRYGHPPDKIAIRGFDLTFDILLKLAYKKNLESTSYLIGETEYLGTKFDYYPSWPRGYYNQAGYLLQYDNLNLVERK